MSKPSNQQPPADEFGKIRAFLARAGVSQSDIVRVIGNGSRNRTRAAIADELRAWLKDLPKA